MIDTVALDRAVRIVLPATLNSLRARRSIDISWELRSLVRGGVLETMRPKIIFEYHCQRRAEAKVPA